MNSERVFLGNVAPAGAFNLEYKHWFNGPEPQPWSLHAAPPKPPAATWDGTVITNNRTTTSAAGSTATSKWEVDAYTAPKILGGGYFAKYYTKSTANAKKPDKDAHSRTRITDPWSIDAPENNTEIDGQWSILGNMTLAGSIQGNGSIGSSYSVNLRGSNTTYDFFSVQIATGGVSVTANNVPFGMGLDLYFGSSSNFVPITVTQLQTMLNSHYQPDGTWNWAGDLDLGSFDTDPDAYRDQTLSIFAVLKFDSSVTGVDIHTETMSAANAAVPEASTYGIVAVAGLLALCFIRKKIRQ